MYLKYIWTKKYGFSNKIKCVVNQHSRKVSTASTLSKAEPLEEGKNERLANLGKNSASTVVIGGGVVGTSIAYHLAKQGEKNVVLLEKSELTAGSTWHAAGLTTLYHPTINLKRLHYYSINMYSKISAETDQEVGFHQPGSLRIATTPQLAEELKFQMAKAGVQDAPQRLMTPEEIKQVVPLVEENKVLLGLFTPRDGHIDPYSLTQAIAKGARKFGASISQGVEVSSLRLRDDGKWVIGTSQGELLADRVVNAAGFWAKEVGKLAGLDLPVVPIEHQYLVTSTVPEIQSLKNEFPVLRLLEASCYVRQERDGFLVGTYETQSAMKTREDWIINGVPKGFGRELFPSDIDRQMPHLEKVMEVIPTFASANVQSIVNGPITYTPDLLPMVGPSLLPNMWLAVGFGYGIIHGGGAGKYLADWIQNGEPPHDLIECDPGRFSTWTSDSYVFAKARESYGMNNAIPYPHEERFAGRPTSRVTPAFQKQIERGAHMVIDAGWEHPGWFADPGERPEYKPSFGRTNWHSAVKREWNTVTTKVGLIDLSTFGKFYLEGDQAAQFVDYVTANRVPPVGRSAVTHLLTTKAKVYAELTVTRVEPNKFLIVTGSGSELHDLRWLNEIARRDQWNVKLTNISDAFGCLSVAGPKSKELLSKLHPRFKDKFPFFTFDKVDFKGFDCLALRLTYTGELGWEIYHQRSHSGQLYEALLEAGDEYGVGDFGSLTLNVLRLEKGFRLWGKEMNIDMNIVEAGLMSFVDMGKENFIGKNTVEQLLTEFPKRELVMLKISNESPYDPEGDESIWVDGKVVGSTTSGCYSCLINQPISFAYLPPFLTTSGTKVQVEMMDEFFEAEVLPRSPGITYNEKLAKQKLKK